MNAKHFIRISVSAMFAMLVVTIIQLVVQNDGNTVALGLWVIFALTYFTLNFIGFLTGDESV